MHLLERDELSFFDALAEQRQGRWRDRGPGPPAPARFEILGNPFVQPDRNRIPTLLSNHQMGELVRQRVLPVVTADHCLRAGNDQLAELANRDRAGGGNLLIGEGGYFGQLPGVVDNLDPGFSGRSIAKIGPERFPNRLQRLDRIRGEDFVFSLRVEEILAPYAIETLEDSGSARDRSW